MAAPQVTIDSLTTATRDGADQGSGTFDVLIRSLKEHLHEEFAQGRVQGREFATLYLGALQAALSQAADFVFRTQQSNLDAQIKDQQLALGAVQIQIAQAQLAQVQAQTAHVEAQTAVAVQQRLNLQDELLTAAQQRLNLQAQRAQIEAQTALTTQQKANLVDELLTAAKQRDRLTAEIALSGSQKLQVEAQTDLVGQQKINLAAQKLQTEAETANLAKQGKVLEQNYLKGIQETEVLVQQQNLLIQQVAKLREDILAAPMERDVLAAQRLKVEAERDLIGKKTVTEQAQYSNYGVSTDSVIGRQKELYLAQALGFARDAEQKAVKILVDTWNVRRTTDEGTSGNSTNRLDDWHIGAAVLKMLHGVQVAA